MTNRPTHTNISLFLSTSSDSKVVYRRYASLFFIAGCASTDNELITLEIVHRYVEQMDKYYGNVCELDIIFNFQKAYYILDELLLAGEMQESSKKNVLKAIGQQDSFEEQEVSAEPPTRRPKLYKKIVKNTSLRSCVSPSQTLLTMIDLQVQDDGVTKIM